MADLKAQWQARLDREFPQGAVGSWVRPPNPASHPAIYNIPYIEVLAMAGLDPVLIMTVYGTGSKILGPWRVISYETLAEEPFTARRLTFAGTRDRLVLVDAVGDQMAAMMAQDRAEQKAHPHLDSEWPAATPVA